MENIAQNKRHRCGFLLNGDITGRLVAYKLTNMANGKSYIGITKKGLWRRLSEHAHACDILGHPYAIYAAFRKYGKEAFSAEVLARAETPAELLEIERRLIAEHGTYDKHNGYNQTLGGQGTFGRFHSPETLAKIHAKAHSPESTAARIAKITGRKRPDVAGANSPSNRPDVKRKMIEALTGMARPWTTDRNRANRKLTEDDIRAILLDTRPAKVIAAEYGIASKSTITLICRGQRYKDLYDKVCATLPPGVVERNLKFRTGPRPHMRGDLHHMRRDPDLARRTGEKKRGKPVPHTAARNIANRTLTEDDIRAILADTRKTQDIADAFGKSYTLIHNIRSGKKYADVVARIRAENK